MNKLKGTGIPTRKTAGAIGDIYIDTATGKQYKCVFSYRENTTGEFDCQWKPMDVKNPDQSKVVDAKNPEQGKSVDVKNPEQGKSIGETEVKKTIEPKPESPKETPKKPAGKTNYAAAFNKK